MNEQATMMNPQKQQQQQMMNANQNQMIGMSQMSQPQQQMVPINRSYGMWAPPMQPQLQFQNPNGLSAMKQPSLPFGKSSKPLGPRNNWKGKNVKNDKRRMEQQKALMAGSSTGAPGGGVNISGNLNFNNYNPPTVNELQHQNRLKTRKFFSKKKFNKNSSMNMNMGNNNNKNNSRSAPFAPRNTSSYIIRAKKSGGIASLVSPCPVTPAVLPTPIFSPSREVFMDMAKEEWGVDGYGSMKGLIRLRSPGHELDAHDDEEEDDGGSSESDVEEHVEVERRLDHDLSRFEMIYNPNGINVGGMEYHNVLENRVDDQDTHIAHLEEENLILKERLFLMEREFAELRRRLQGLERRTGHGQEEDINEEVVENESENESVSRGEEIHSTEENNDDLGEENVVGDGDSKGKDVDNLCNAGIEAETMNDQNAQLDIEVKVENNNYGFIEADNNENKENADEKADKNGDESAEASKTEENVVCVEEKEENFSEKNMYVDEEVEVEVKAENNDIVEASEHKTGVDVCMEEVGRAENKAVSEKCLEN